MIPENWIKTVLPLTTSRHKLIVHSAPHAMATLDFVGDYWEERLDGLTRFRSHKWGGTVERFQTDSAAWFIKRFAIRNLRYIHKPRRARQSMAQHIEAKASGFKIPPIVCLIEQRRAGILVDSAIIMEEIPETVSAFHLLNEASHGVANDRVKRHHLLTELGHEIGRWHREGFFHGDMHLENILCKDNGTSRAFYWIDNEEGRKFKALPLRLRVHDLHHINRYKHQIGLTDRMRFWRAYLQEADLPSDQEKTVLRRVVAKSQAYWRKKGWL
jgi:tRNA A-37 threonylcarbamoyl transferase component Bud32